jgi:hypothetical protein
MDNLGKNWQLIYILFCGYRRQSEIHYPPKMRAETYTRPAQVPQQVISPHIFVLIHTFDILI